MSSFSEEKDVRSGVTVHEQGECGVLRAGGENNILWMEFVYIGKND